AGDSPQRAVEPELADEPEPVDGAEWQLLAGDDHPDGDRQIEPGADLARAGRREVHGDALRRPLAPGAHHRRPDAIARLPARRIGLADDAEPWQSLADVDLDAHRDAGGAEQAGGRDG